VCERCSGDCSDYGDDRIEAHEVAVENNNSNKDNTYLNGNYSYYEENANNKPVPQGRHFRVGFHQFGVNIFFFWVDIPPRVPQCTTVV
jgi:hypothetical protein